MNVFFDLRSTINKLLIIKGLSSNLAVYFPCSNSNYLIVPACGWVF